MMGLMSHHDPILIAEDREDDAFLLRRALEMARIVNPIQIVRNGQEAISYLKGEAKAPNGDEYPLPSLLLLDLNMPHTSGFEVLRWIRQQPGLKTLRVIALTSSENSNQVNKAYELGVNSFLVKPMAFKNLVGMSKFLCDYWLQTDHAPAISYPPN